MEAAEQDPVAETSGRNAEALRWAAAEARAAHAPYRPGRDRAAVATVLLLVASAAVLGGAFALLLPRAEIDGTRPAVVAEEARRLAGLGLGIAGLLVFFVGVPWAISTGRIGSRLSSVIGPLTVPERRWAKRVVAGKELLDATKLPVLLALAAQDRRTSLGLVPLMVSIALLVTSSALVVGDPMLIVLQLVVVVVLVAALVQLALVYRRAGRFLDRTLPR